MDDLDARRKADLAAGWWYDARWQVWHPPVRDLGNSAPRYASDSLLPPHLRPRVAPDTTPTPSEAPEAVPVAAAPESEEIDDDTALRLLATWLKRLASKL